MELKRYHSGVIFNEPVAICLGCFDGIHQGHQALLKTTQQLAKEHHLLSACLSFEPYPKHFFAKKFGKPILPRLMRFRDKCQALSDLCLDRFVVCSFNDALAQLSAKAFVNDILVNGIKARCVVVGEDFRFGVKREAGVSELIALCKEQGVSVTVVSDVLVNQERVSSTDLREALQEGDLDSVKHVLGRDYSVSGCVRRGQARGRQIGFPTANVHMPPNTLPMVGVFVVELIRADGSIVPGVANVGPQPTVDQYQTRLEVHGLDFEGDLYHEQVQVRFLKHLRGVMRFSGLDALKAQIALDKAAAEDYFRLETGTA